MEIAYDTAFKKDYKIWQKKNPDKAKLLVKAIDLFIENTFSPIIKNP